MIRASLTILQPWGDVSGAKSQQADNSVTERWEEWEFPDESKNQKPPSLQISCEWWTSPSKPFLVHCLVFTAKSIIINTEVEESCIVFNVCLVPKLACKYRGLFCWNKDYFYLLLFGFLPYWHSLSPTQGYVSLSTSSLHSSPWRSKWTINFGIVSA